MTPPQPATAEAHIDRKRLAALTAGELDRYRERGPRSAERFARAQEVLLAGVPMSWMLKWAGAFPIEHEAGAFPIFGSTAQGSRLVDVDGNEYIDFCLGDTGAMTGHSPRSSTMDLQPSSKGPDLHAADGLGDRGGGTVLKRFGLAKWQFTVSATDANRFSIRLARELTGRQKILVFNHCYHGTVDEVFASLDAPAT